MTQLTLPGFEATPQLSAHHLFLTTKPDVDTAERIARLTQQLRPVVGFKGKALCTERLHATLHHLGDFVYLPPKNVVARVRATADNLAIPAFDAIFNQMVSLHGRRDHRPFALLGDGGMGGLTASQATLGEAFEHAAAPMQRGPFKPYIMLLYNRGGFAAKVVEPITWTVRESAFTCSWLGKAHYDELGRWALKG